MRAFRRRRHTLRRPRLVDGAAVRPAILPVIDTLHSGAGAQCVCVLVVFVECRDACSAQADGTDGGDSALPKLRLCLCSWW